MLTSTTMKSACSAVLHNTYYLERTHRTETSRLTGLSERLLIFAHGPTDAFFPNKPNPASPNSALSATCSQLWSKKVKHGLLRGGGSERERGRRESKKEKEKDL